MAGKAFNLSKGVFSFNGRKGVVIPKHGDYTAEMVSAADKTLSNLSDTQSSLSSLGAGVRPNLLDNAYFIGNGSQTGRDNLPINQLGKSNYTIQKNYSYTIDRWWGYRIGATITLSNQGLVVSLPSSVEGIYASICQYVGLNLSNYQGETVTLSTLVNNSLFSATGVIPSNPSVGVVFISSFPNGSFVFRYSPDGLYYVELRTTNGATNTFAATKLEFGPNQTLAYKDSSGVWQLLPQPDVPTLWNCQYYQFQLCTAATYQSIGTGYCISETQAVFVVPIPRNMRLVVPTLTADATKFSLYTNGSYIPCTELSLSCLSNSTAKIVATASGLTLGQSAILTNGANGSATLLLDANL